MGSGTKAKASASPRGVGRTQGALPSDGAGASAEDAKKAPKEQLIPLDRVDPSVLSRAAVQDAVSLKDDGTTITVLWKGRTLGIVRRSFLVSVRESKINVGRIARIEAKRDAAWITLG